MNLRSLALSIVILGAAPALAADPPRPPSPQDGLRTWVAARLPKGWRARTEGLPTGVALVVQGPRTVDGRAAIALRPIEGGAPSDARALAAALSRARGVEVSVEIGPIGWELVPPPTASGTRLLWIVADEGVLTLAAPSRQFVAAYRRVVKAGLAARR